MGCRRHKPYFCLVLASLCLLPAACGEEKGPTEVVVVMPPPPPPPPPPQTPLPLLAGVYELNGISHLLPQTDLAPLAEIIGSAKFVALGESTHRSHGYYQAKYRLIRYMVEHLGFRALGFETSYHESMAATRYVATCQGSARDAVLSMTPVWHDTSVRDMLQWMCAWNQSNPGDPVSFYGFDIQEPGQSALAIDEFLAGAAAPEAGRATPLRRCIGANHARLTQWYQSQEFRDWMAGIRNPQEHAQCIAGIDGMESWIALNTAALTAASSATAVETTRLALVALRAWQNQLVVPDPGGYQARDFGMAELARRLQAVHAPGKKTILWAWNWHIALNYQDVRGFDENPQQHVGRQGARAMGGFLHDALGADYLPIALIGYRVEMHGVPPVPLQSNPLSIEHRLNDFGRDYLLVDLRQPRSDWVIRPDSTYRISQEWGEPFRQFRAALFLRHSLPMLPVF